MTGQRPANGVTIGMQKGGVGKTALAINLSERLANRGHRVLLVDLDPQGNATDGVGEGDAYATAAHLGHALDPDDPTDVVELICPVSAVGDLDLLPSHPRLRRIALELSTTENGDFRLREAVAKPLAERYDWIIYDTPAGSGPLSDAALLASRRAILPMQLTKPSADALTQTVTEQLRPLNDRLDGRITLLAVVPNRVKGDNEEKRVLEALEESVFEPTLPEFARSARYDDPETSGPGIRERIAFRRAYREGLPLARYDPRSDMIERLDDLASIVERSANIAGEPETDPGSKRDRRVR